jgi:hypothetical protein
VIETEEYTVCHPTPATKHTFHPGQQHAPKKELLSQNSVEQALITNKAKNYQAPSSRPRISCDWKITSKL